MIEVEAVEEDEFGRTTSSLGFRLFFSTGEVFEADDCEYEFVFD